MAANSPPYYTFRQCLVDLYGAPLYRVPIDLGLGCPHRALDGTGGCAFCGPDGSRSTRTAPGAPLEEQIREGIAWAARRYPASRFMAYVQAFTGTHAPADRLRELYLRILRTHPFPAFLVATRPDCLPPDTLEVLAELRTRTDVWIEIGVQTVHDETLRRMHRGHDWACSREAILACAARGLRVAVHVILGLPGETVEDFRATAEALAELPLQGIKIHNLHVVRGSALESLYRIHPFPLLDEAGYREALITVLRHLPRSVAVLRAVTDTPPDQRVAPHWKMTKSQFLDSVRKEMERRGLQQGDACRRRHFPAPRSRDGASEAGACCGERHGPPAGGM